MMEYGQNWDKFNKKMFAELANKLSFGNTRPVPIRKEVVEEERELTREEKNVIAWGARLYHFPVYGKSSDEVRDYLESRGIDKHLISHFQIGNALSGLMVSELMRLPPVKRDQILDSCLFYKLEDGSYNSEISISNSSGEKHYFELLRNRIIFPDIDKNGNCLSIVGRIVGKPASKKVLRFLSLNDVPKTIWGLARVNPDLPVIITEGLVDVINILSLGYQAITPLGTGIAYRHDSALKKIKHLIILPQNDERGKEAVEVWKTRFDHARVLNIPYCNNEEDFEKDFNDIYVRRGRVDAGLILREKLRDIGYKIEPLEITG